MSKLRYKEGGVWKSIAPSQKEFDDNKAEVTASLADKVEKGEGGAITWGMAAQDFREQITGGNTAVVGVDSVLKENIVDGAVAPEKTSFFDVSPNMFDEANALKETRMTTGGTASANASYITSHEFIGVLEGQQVTSSYRVIATNARAIGGRYLIRYDANFNYLGGHDNTVYPFTIPTGTKYIKLSVIAGGLYDQFQLQTVGTNLNYRPFKQAFIDPQRLRKEDIVALGNSRIENLEPFDFISNLNLFDKNSITDNMYINNQSGVLGSNISYVAGAFIPVRENTKYYGKNFHLSNLAFYNVKKEFIGTGTIVNGQITTPTGSAYVRLSISKEFYSVSDAIFSDLPLTGTFFPYGKITVNPKYIDEPINRYVGKLDVYLPPEICVAVGRTIELYNNQVCLQTEKFQFQWVSPVGKFMKRKFSVTGTVETIGNHALTLNIIDENLKVVWTGTTTIKVVAEIPTAISVLPLGDSLSNGKIWLHEVPILSNGKVSYIGTKESTMLLDGTNYTLKHEGYPGWNASHFLNNSTVSGVVNPFYNTSNSRFDWSYYKTSTGLNPNAVQIYLGTNGMALDPTLGATSIKSLVDYVRQDDATIPIYLVHTIFKGNQDGIGAQTSNEGYSSSSGVYKYEEDLKVFNLMNRLKTLLTGYTGLHFVPLATCHDSEYNFGAVSKAVNPRAIQMELMPIESVHPQTQGYLQMADIMYSSYSAHTV